MSGEHWEGVWVQGDGGDLPPFRELVGFVDASWKPKPLDGIKQHIRQILKMASESPGMSFKVLGYGRGTEGYLPKDIGSAFSMIPPNVKVPRDLEPFVKGISGPYGMGRG